MTAARPRCVHCGAVYGKRSTTCTVITWSASDRFAPPYHGNGIIVRHRGRHGPTAMLEAALGRPKNEHDRYDFVDVWDGESYLTPYEPFCTLRCALSYARKTYAARNRTPSVVT